MPFLGRHPGPGEAPLAISGDGAPTYEGSPDPYDGPKARKTQHRSRVPTTRDASTDGWRGARVVIPSGSPEPFPASPTSQVGAPLDGSELVSPPPEPPMPEPSPMPPMPQSLMLESKVELEEAATQEGSHLMEDSHLEDDSHLDPEVSASLVEADGARRVRLDVDAAGGYAGLNSYQPTDHTTGDVFLTCRLALSATGVPDLEDVVDLDLENQRLTCAPSYELRDIPNLATLNVASNRLLLEDFAGCRRLRSLDLTQNGVVGVVLPLHPFPALTTLCLAHNTLTTSALDSLTAIPKLETLDLTSCRLVTEHLHELRGCPSLRQLQLSGNRITAWPRYARCFIEALGVDGWFPALETVFISDNKINECPALYPILDAPNLVLVEAMRNPVAGRASRAQEQELYRTFQEEGAAVVLFERKHPGRRPPSKLGTSRVGVPEAYSECSVFEHILHSRDTPLGELKTEVLHLKRLSAVMPPGGANAGLGTMQGKLELAAGFAPFTSMDALKVREVPTRKAQRARKDRERAVRLYDDNGGRPRWGHHNVGLFQKHPDQLIPVLENKLGDVLGGLTSSAWMKEVHDKADIAAYRSRQRAQKAKSTRRAAHA